MTDLYRAFFSWTEKVAYDSNSVPIFAIKDMPEHPKDMEKDKAQDILVIEEDVPRIVLMSSQTNITARWDRIVLVAIGTKWLVKIGHILEKASTQAGMTASGIIDALKSKPYKIIVLTHRMTHLSLQNTKELPQASPLPQLSYTINVMCLLSTSRNHRYAWASTLFTFCLTWKGFNRWKTMSSSLKKIKKAHWRLKRWNSLQQQVQGPQREGPIRTVWCR